MFLPPRVLFVLLPLASTSVATAADASLDCYDLKVLGATVSQRELPMPDCKGCIYFAVPYVLQIKVKKVLEGTDASSRLVVRSIQHMAEPQELRTWWLRRNSANSYNRVEYDQSVQPRRCRIKMPPAKPISFE